MDRTPGPRRLLGLAVAVLSATLAAADHDKTDVVTTDDGNTFIGDIQKVQYATLTLTTDAAGQLSIEWRRVTGVTSRFEYRVELAGGVRHFGSLGKPGPGRLSIAGAEGSVEVDLNEVVQIVPIEHGFWKRLNGSVGFGLTYTQANDALQYNLNGNAAYRTRRNFGELQGQSIFNTQRDGESTEQHSLKLTVSQIARKSWGSFELAQLQSNPDQGYDQRWIAGGGATNFLIESSAKLLALNLGAVYNLEEVTDSPQVDDSVEALVSVALRRFKRGSHSPIVQLTLEVFANVTGGSRLRTVLYFSVGWEIVSDFTFNVQVNNSYDSNPPGTDSENNDGSVVTSIGYTF